MFVSCRNSFAGLVMLPELRFVRRINGREANDAWLSQTAGSLPHVSGHTDFPSCQGGVPEGRGGCLFMRGVRVSA
jgi:hypothetical protein